MSLIEKIDAEIKRIESLPDNDGDLDGEEIYDDGRQQGWYEEVLRIKQIILSEQKEDNCILDATYYTDNSLTIGDKIRESNESLRNAMYDILKSQECDSNCPSYESCDCMCDCETKLLDYLNQPYTNQPTT
jgi:hypothetical protein